MGLLRRQLVTSAFVANALRPLTGTPRTAVASFTGGFVFIELAPQLLAATAADTGLHAVRPGRTGRGWRGGLALGLGVANTAALAYLTRRALQVGPLVEEALTEGLGVDYAEQLDAAPTPADLAVPWRRLGLPFAVRDKQVRVERDIAYAPSRSKRARLDVYLPPETPDGPVTGAPVLLQVHGGAWSMGRKEDQALPLMYHLAARGWICVSVNYRLAPKHRWPAQVVDVKRALAWVKEHIADYGGDPDYVAITGGSAGGHLAALTALTPGDPTYQPGFEGADTSVQVAVPLYGVYDLAGATGLRSAEVMRDAFLARRLFGTRYADDPAAFEQASPLLRVTPDAPDFLVVHGTHDSLVDVGQARAFVERLRAVSKRSVVYAELPASQHAFDTFTSIRSAHVVRAVDRYLHWHWNGWRRDRPVVTSPDEVAARQDASGDQEGGA